MTGYIIIHDVLEETKLGDLSVYESVEAALSAMEPYDVCDPNIHVYDETGDRFALIHEGGWPGILSLERTGTRFEGLGTLLALHAARSGLRVESEQPDNLQLAEAIFLYDPNPYSGIAPTTLPKGRGPAD